MALATATDLITRCDTQLVGDLITDDDPDTGIRSRPTRAEILASDVVSTLMDDAHALFLAAVRVGNRYTTEQIEAATGAAANYIKRIECDLWVQLGFQRRPDKANSEIAKQYEDRVDKHLKALRAGEEIIGLADNTDADAGLMETDGPNALDLTDRNLIDERMHRYFPGGNQRLPLSRR